MNLPVPARAWLCGLLVSFATFCSVAAADDLVVLGAIDAYEARCRMCYDPTEPEQPELGWDGE